MCVRRSTGASLITNIFTSNNNFDPTNSESSSGERGPASSFHHHFPNRRQTHDLLLENKWWQKLTVVSLPSNYWSGALKPQWTQNWTIVLVGSCDKNLQWKKLKLTHFYKVEDGNLENQLQWKEGGKMWTLFSLCRAGWLLIQQKSMKAVQFYIFFSFGHIYMQRCVHTNGGKFCICINMHVCHCHGVESTSWALSSLSCFTRFVSLDFLIFFWFRYYCQYVLLS